MIKKIITFMFVSLLWIKPLYSQDNIKLNIGLITNMPPISYINDYNQPSGIFIDILNIIAENENWDINYITGTFSHLYNKTINNELDIMVGVTKTNEREQLLKYNKEPVISSWSQVFINPKTININNILDLDGKTIGLIRLDNNGKSFLQIVKSFDININVKYFDSYKLLEQAVLNKKINGGVFLSLYESKSGILKESNIIFNPSGSWFVINKQRKDLYNILNVLDEYLIEWKQNKNSIYYKLLKKYYDLNYFEDRTIPFHIYLLFFIPISLVLLLYFWSKFLRLRIKKQNILLNEKNNQYHQLFETMNQGFIYCKLLYDNGKVIDCEILETNDDFFNLLEISNNVIGKSLKNIFENYKFDFNKILKEIQNINSDYSIKFEHYHKFLDKWYYISIYSPKQDHIVMLISDITKRKISEELLRQSEMILRENQKRLSITFESIGDGVIVINNNFKVTMMNRMAKTILNIDKEYYGVDLDQIFNLKNINLNGKSIKEITKKVLIEKKPYYIYKAELYIKNINKTKIIEDSISPIYDDDTTYGVVIVFRDITDKINNLNKQKELETQLNRSQKLETIGQFAGGIAHNFNNIITAINGYASLIKQKVGDDFKYIDELNEIENAVTKASKLTKQLLTVSKKQVTQLDILDPNDILKSLTNMMYNLVNEDIKIKTYFNSTKLIKADQNQIEQIVLNFIVNARDALENKDNKTIIIETQDFYADENYSKNNLDIKSGEYVLISFSDTGSGIDKNNLDKIFDPFFTTKKNKGTGLGLSTVYGIIQQNKAAIHVYSEVNKGTTFKIYWPVTYEKKEIELENKKEINIKGNETILFVEDEKSLQGLAQEFLSDLGYNVVIAFDGKDGIKKFKENKNINLIITDIVMPNMNGVELYKQIQKTNPNVKVLFTSGYTKNYLIENELKSNNSIQFIAKPYSLIILAEKIREMLDN